MLPFSNANWKASTTPRYTSGSSIRTCSFPYVGTLLMSLKGLESEQFAQVSYLFAIASASEGQVNLRPFHKMNWLYFLTITVSSFERCDDELDSTRWFTAAGIVNVLASIIWMPVRKNPLQFPSFHMGLNKIFRKIG